MTMFRAHYVLCRRNTQAIAYNIRQRNSNDFFLFSSACRYSPWAPRSGWPLHGGSPAPGRSGRQRGTAPPPTAAAAAGPGAERGAGGGMRYEHGSRRAAGLTGAAAGEAAGAKASCRPHPRPELRPATTTTTPP